VNVFGTFLVTQAAIRLLRNSPRASIINFVGGGEGAFPNFSAYAASKGAVARFTETAAAELRHANIAVNAIAPGAVNTKMTEAMLAAGANAGEQYEKALNQKEKNATAEKAVALVRFLCGERARDITGRVISAQWDDFERFPDYAADIVGSDIYTMRRIRPKDRGFDWE
jgi:NAD(P)-dependent dehydrogenase (short-subunit alcohol dehydrogenase family)